MSNDETKGYGGFVGVVYVPEFDGDTYKATTFKVKGKEFNVYDVPFKELKDAVLYIHEKN
jgi:hypothetical protein